MMEKYGVDDVVQLQRTELEKVQGELARLRDGGGLEKSAAERDKRVRVLETRRKQLENAIKGQ